MPATEILPTLRSIALLAALSLSLSACEGTTLGHFDVDESLPESRIEGSAVAVVLPLLLPAMPLDISTSEVFQQEEFDFLTSIQLDALTLNITESSSDDTVDTLEDGNLDNFDFISSMDIYIQAEFDGESQRELIGAIADDDPQLSAGLQSISFTMTGVDILRFVEAESGYEVQIEASGVAPPDTVVFDGEVRYRVGIGFR